MEVTVIIHGFSGMGQPYQIYPTQVPAEKQGHMELEEHQVQVSTREHMQMK